MKKIDGVETAEVSLNRGEVVVWLRPGNGVMVERVRNVIRSNGFTPKAAEVRVEGKVIEHAGQLAFAVPSQNRVYRLMAHPQAQGVIPRLREAVGRNVVIEGTVPETPKQDSPIESIQVRRLVASPGS